MLQSETRKGVVIMLSFYYQFWFSDPEYRLSVDPYWFFYGR